MRFDLMETIGRTGIFVICAQVLIHFRPNGSYEKYLKMLMSAMILLQLFLPLGNIFAGDEEKSLAAQVARFQEQLEQSMEQVVENQARREAILNEMTLAEVQRLAALEAAGEAVAGTVGEEEAAANGGIRIEPLSVTAVDKVDAIELEKRKGGRSDEE